MLVVCLCISRKQLLNAWSNVYKTGMPIMAPEPISTAYFINPCHQCVCVCLYVFTPPIIARQRLRKNVFAATNTHIPNRWSVGRVVLHAVRIVSNESRRLVLPIASWCLWFILHHHRYLNWVIRGGWFGAKVPGTSINEHQTYLTHTEQQNSAHTKVLNSNRRAMILILITTVILIIILTNFIPQRTQI
jgi:hypothetical protein